MDIEKQVDYWEKSAEHDLDTANSLILPRESLKRLKRNTDG